jgi:hypothetical protein
LEEVKKEEQTTIETLLALKGLFADLSGDVPLELMTIKKAFP